MLVLFYYLPNYAFFAFQFDLACISTADNIITVHSQRLGISRILNLKACNIEMKKIYNRYSHVTEIIHIQQCKRTLTLLMRRQDSRSATSSVDSE